MEGLTWTYYGFCLLVLSVSPYVFLFPCLSLSLSLFLITIILSFLPTSLSPLSHSPLFFILIRVFLYNPNWPGTHYVGHDFSNFQQSSLFFLISYVLEL